MIRVETLERETSHVYANFLDHDLPDDWKESESTMKARRISSSRRDFVDQCDGVKRLPTSTNAPIE